MSQATHVRLSCGCCFIVPPRVLRALSQGRMVPAADRQIYQESFAENERLRLVRKAYHEAAMLLRRSHPAPAPAGSPEELTYDMQHHTRPMPGHQVDPASGEAFRTVHDTTSQVAAFYSSVLGRNSVDNRGMNLLSSLNYGRNYQNAFWNGQQMVYGNGDQKVFIDFWRSPDVIGHELTHGVTQYESGLQYQGESGALNESLSDCFGVTFNQWLNKWPTHNSAGWLVGAGIMGPQAKYKGYTCLRDMVDPGAQHCLSPQPSSYDQYDPAGDVHDNSGIPNKAYALFARELGGNSWDAAIKVWYAAATGGHLSANATIAEFAHASIAAADRWTGANRRAVAAAVRHAWAEVKVPLPSA